MKKKLYIVDGHALCYRAYFAFIKNPLINSDGQNTSAIFGFARMLLKLIKEEKPDYIAVAFDPPKKSFRFELYPEYKANRQKMPPDLKSQVEEIKNLVDVLGIKRLMEMDYEADDILGTVAKNFASKDLEVMLVTGDKDAYQLVGPNVRIYANKKGITEYEIYDAKEVESKLGLPPGKVIDYMALTGDSSDNVPGVKGIGEKTAQKLIETFGSLEKLYERIDEIKGKQKELLSAQRDMAFLSRTLVTIKTDIPVDIDVESMKITEIFNDQTKEYFRKMEMPSIIRDFFGGETPVEKPERKPEKKDYRIIRTEEDLMEMLRLVDAKGEVSIDTETTSVSPVDAELVGASFSIKEREGWYLPVMSGGMFSEKFIDPSRSLELIRKMVENPKVRKIGQNIKYDIIVFSNHGIEMKGVYFDTMVASYVLNPSERRHNLDDLAEEHLSYKTITYKELTGTGKNAVPLVDVPLERVAEYAIEDADITWRLYLIFRERLAEHEMEKLFYDIEMPLVPVLAEMEKAGVRIDPKYFAKLGRQNEKMLSDVERKIYRAAGQEFNINSTRELSVILFEKLGLKPQKKTKTGFSTDIQVLENLKGVHPVIDDLISYRTLSKLKNTYIDSLPRIISPKTGRIHTSYNQTVVATGRLSSSDPNLQNIPVRDEFGKNIRKGFIPADGFIMMSADYSQIELRLAAHLSGDRNMINAFKSGIDIHNMTASSVFGVSIDRVTPDMRRQAKIINFATIYGVSPYGLSQQADIGIREAAEFIRIYYETYPGFKEFIEKTIAFAREKGYVQTLLGRRRYIPDISSDISFRREGAERVAINTPIQGTSADMIKIAMINIAGRTARAGMGSRMILQVHDELVFEVPSGERDGIGELVKTEMENALKLSVPIVVDVGWGNNWDEAH